MKKKFWVIIMLLGIMLPFKVLAKTYYDDYSTLNFKETLKQESMEILNKNYKEDDKQTIIYMFRGNGCGFCRNFLTFLNSISEEYGKYFRLVSFEVWGDTNNNSLMNKVAGYTGVAARGVPYIIIGDKVFDGYAADYDEAIKEAIMNQYDKNDADIFEKIAKAEKGNSVSSFAVIFWNFVIVAVATGINIYISNKNTEKVLNALNDVKKEEKKEEKKVGRKKKNEE